MAAAAAGGCGGNGVRGVGGGVRAPQRGREESAAVAGARLGRWPPSLPPRHWECRGAEGAGWRRTAGGAAAVREDGAVRRL